MTPLHSPGGTPRRSRALELVLLFTGACWVGAAYLTAQHAAEGLSVRLHALLAAPLLAAVFTVFLLLAGLTTLQWIATRDGGVRRANALPRRPTARQEWMLGAAIGWGMALAVVLPSMLAGVLHPHLWGRPVAWLNSLLALATAFVAAFAGELAFRGYLFRRAINALGPTLATVLLSATYAFLSAMTPNATGTSVMVIFCLGVLFSVAYLRTQALWLGWGLHCAWVAVLSVVFGLPVGGMVAFNGVVDMESSGRSWITGAAYGPEGAMIALLVVLLALIVVYRATRDYAWSYTHPPIVSAGYPMDVAPPAAHTAMEAQAAVKETPLVQIAGLPLSPALPPSPPSGSGVEPSRSGSELLPPDA